MESAFTLVTLFLALILIAITTDARPDPGSMAGVVVEDKQIQGLLGKGTSVLHVPHNTKNANCHKADTNEQKPFVKDEFEHRPNVSVYDNGVGLKNGEAKVDDFKPREIFWVYRNKGNSLKNKKGTDDNDDFKPGPNISVYDNGVGLKNEMGTNDDFEPRPNISVYDNGVGLKNEKGTNDDFEPRPNISVYDNVGLKNEKGNNDDFEPRPNISTYNE